MPWDQACEDYCDADVEQGADEERREDADGHIAPRMPALLACGRDRIEPDVGEEDDRTAGENARPSVGREGMVVCRMDEAEAEEDEEQDSRNLDQHHDVVGAG